MELFPDIFLYPCRYCADFWHVSQSPAFLKAMHTKTVLVVRSGGSGLGNLFMAVANHVGRSRRRDGDMIHHSREQFPSPLPPDRTTNLLYCKVFQFQCVFS